MAAIRDVAKRAGVSVATVSHVINGTRKVAPGTAERVGVQKLLLDPPANPKEVIDEKRR